MHRSPSLTATVRAGAKTQGLGLRAPTGVRVVPARVCVQPWKGPGGAAVSDPLFAESSIRGCPLTAKRGLQVGQAFNHSSSSSSSSSEEEEEEEA